MTWAINWNVLPGDPVLAHPMYQKYSTTKFGAIDIAAVKTDLGQVVADNPSSPVVAYLCWILRIRTLTAD
jgi:hypothetical protein